MATISIGMPVYNGERFLAPALDAVLAQTYGDFELLIGDNGSTDDTEVICRDYAARDARIRYHRHPQNIGAAANYNDLFARATAPYFRWNNADDLVDPTLHEKCLAALKRHPDAVLAAGTTVLINEDGATLRFYNDDLHITDRRPSDRYRRFLRQVGLTNVLYGLMRRENLVNTELMGDGSLPSADTILMADLLFQGTFVMLDEPLFYRRMHDDSNSADRDDQDWQEHFWSAGRRDLNRPEWRRMFAYRRAIARRALPVREKLSAYRTLLRLVWSYRSDLGREVVNPSY
ncbi:MAG: glycosyltransferase family 2 protein [Pseudomonadota bacterium]